MTLLTQELPNFIDNDVERDVWHKIISNFKAKAELKKVETNPSTSVSSSKELKRQDQWDMVRGHTVKVKLQVQVFGL